MITNKICVFLFALAAILPTYATDDCFYPTGLDSRWKRRCKRSQFISTLDSVFKNKYGDRSWKICCRKLPFLAEGRWPVKCSNWTGYVNTYGGVLDYICPNDGFIAGIRSKHSSKREDRIFRFKCCNFEGYVMENCKSSGIVNGFNQRAVFTVQYGRVLVGMGAIFRDHYKDRLFEYQDCLMKKRSLAPDTETILR